MVDYSGFKVPVFANVNDKPTPPSATAAGNGSHLISLHNQLIDQVQADITAMQAAISTAQQQVDHVQQYQLPALQTSIGNMQVQLNSLINQINQSQSGSGGANNPTTGQGSTPSTGFIPVTDTFTAADNTSLTSHVQDQGNGWVVKEGASAIVSNHLQPNQFGGSYGIFLAITDIGISDKFTVSVDLKFNPLNNIKHGVVVFYTDENNLVFVGCEPVAGTLVIISLVNGDFVTKGSSPLSFSVDTVYTLAVNCNGSNIFATVNGANQVTTNLDSNPNSTKVGLWFDDASVLVDNFSVKQLQ